MSQKTICVIEDNAPIRKLYCTLLKKSGLNTVEFSDAASTLEWLKNNTPDAIIMDILLPDINGTELIGIIREMPACKGVPVVAATGFATSNDRDKFLELGFDSYISKPVNTKTFVNDIISVIEK